MYKLNVIIAITGAVMVAVNMKSNRFMHIICFHSEQIVITLYYYCVCLHIVLIKK